MRGANSITPSVNSNTLRNLTYISGFNFDTIADVKGNKHFQFQENS